MLTSCVGAGVGTGVKVGATLGAEVLLQAPAMAAAYWPEGHTAHEVAPEAAA